MVTEFTIQRVTVNDAPDVTAMVGELLEEIMATIGIQAFHLDVAETTERLTDFISREKYFVFVACGVSIAVVMEPFRLRRNGATGFAA